MKRKVSLAEGGIVEAQVTGTSRKTSYADSFVIGFMSTLGMFAAFYVMQNRNVLADRIKKLVHAVQETG